VFSVCPSNWVRFWSVFGGCLGVRFAKGTDTIIVGKGVSVEHRSRLRLNKVLDRIEIRRFPKDRIFDGSG